MQEEFFETEDCDDISELITKTELSTSRWEEGNYDVSKIKNVEILQEIIKQKDSKLILSAEIGSRLLKRERRLNDSNSILQVHIQSLEDEVRQLKFEQKNYKQKRGEDEEAIRTLLQRSNSVKIERSKQLQEQVKVLKEDVHCLIEELTTLQVHVQQEVDGVKEMLKERLESATTEVVALERKVETIQNKYNVFDYDASSFKSFIQDLANHCLSQEENIESLNLQIQDIKRGRDQEKKEMGNLIFENDGLRKVLSNLRERLKEVERGRLPKVLRHVNDATSPYIDSRCLAQELEQTPTSENYRFHKKLSLQPASYYSNYNNGALMQQYSNNLLHITNGDTDIAEEEDSSAENASKNKDVECTNASNLSFFNLPMTPFQVESLLNKFERYIGEDKLGQPGRVGSQDLNLAVQSMKFKQSLLHQCYDYNERFDSFFKDKVCRINDAPTDVFDKSKSDCCTNNCNTYVNIHNEITHKTVYNVNNFFNFNQSASRDNLSRLSVSQVNTNEKSKIEVDHYDSRAEKRQNSSLLPKMKWRSSRLVDDWAGLWECSVTDVFKTKSGVWIKGSQCNDYFIEEDFSNLEEDESYNQFGNLLKAGSFNNITNCSYKKAGSISDLNKKFLHSTERSSNGACSMSRRVSPRRSKLFGTSISISSTPTSYPNTPTISICNDSGYENEIDSSVLVDDVLTKKLSKTSETLKSNKISTTPKTTSIFFKSMNTSRPQLNTNKSMNDVLESKAKRPTYFTFPSSSYEESSLLKKILSSSSNTQSSPFSFSMDDLRASPIQHQSHKYASTNNFLDTSNCTFTCKNESTLNGCLKLYPCK